MELHRPRDFEVGYSISFPLLIYAVVCANAALRINVLVFHRFSFVTAVQFMPAQMTSFGYYM